MRLLALDVRAVDPAVARSSDVVTSRMETTSVKFLLLLRGDVAGEAAMTDARRRAMVDEHIGYAAMLRERGAYVYGDALDTPETARVLRFDGPEPTVTDGPFLESKESLGGFYVIECGSVDGATELARQLPRSPGLVAELRPIPEV